MTMEKLENLFYITTGHDLELNSLELDSFGINYVSRTRKNNGISAKIKSLDIKPMPKDTITVALSSASVLFAFLQEKPYYTGYHIACLTPKFNMSKQEKLFYCMCITTNRFRYNFGRQANKTINQLLVPSYEDIPTWVNETNIIDLSNITDKCDKNVINFSKIEYGKFYFNEIFVNVSKTKRHKFINVNLVSAQTADNGISGSVYTDTYINGNKITISSNGINTGTAFYQKNEFVTQDSLAFDLKDFELNKYIAMYLVTILNMNKFKFNYGRKSGKNRLDKLILNLPINSKGKPNYKIMEKYVKSLSYSKSL